MHFQISNDEESTSGNTFEEDPNSDPMIDQMFEDNEEVDGAKKVAEDQEIDQNFSEEPEVEDKIAQNGHHKDEEIAGPKVPIN